MGTCDRKVRSSREHTSRDQLAAGKRSGGARPPSFGPRCSMAGHSLNPQPSEFVSESEMSICGASLLILLFFLQPVIPS